MVLVAMCMVALIAMAALSIDVVTLYLDREEAQRSADAAALAAARVISISGITGTADPDTDTTQWQGVCGTAGTATQVAQQIGALNAIGGVAPTVTVNYSVSGSASGTSDCSGLSQAFAINPTVIVQVRRTGLPTLFSRIWSSSTNSVSATAAAEVFNPSDSGGFTPGGQVIPVVPRCVKPFIVPDEDPTRAPGTHFMFRGNGRISSPGIASINAGIIGENFQLQNDCNGPGPSCSPSGLFQNPPGINTTTSPVGVYYVPAFISTTPPAVATPSCATNDFQSAIAGCDESTQYQCGTVNGANADLSSNRGSDISTATMCLTNLPTGNDILTPGTYPFQITAGSSNLIAPTNQLITTSNSIITVPVYDDRMGTRTRVPFSTTTTSPTITIEGFLQLFVNSVDPSNGNMNVTVMNVAGCGDNASTTAKAFGSSPVPIRLITPQ
jgi:Putative Flp pilus-assembly TadE/G-like